MCKTVILHVVILLLYLVVVSSKNLRPRKKDSTQIAQSPRLQSDFDLDAGPIYSYANFTDTWTVSYNSANYWESCALSGSGQYAMAGTTSKAGLYISGNYQASWSAVTTTFIGQEVSCTSISNNGQYMVVGIFCGYLYFSSDYGSSWTENTLVSECWTSLSASFTGQIVVAAADDSYIFISVNYGETFALLSASTSAFYTGVAISSNSTYIIATAQQYGVFVSSNLGTSWSLPLSGALYWKCTATSATGQFMYAAAADSSVYISSDYGVTFTISNPLVIYEWTSITCSSSGQIVALAGYYGNIYLSIDYGANWFLSTSGALEWNGVASNSAGDQFVAIAYGAGIYLGTLYADPTVSPSVSPTLSPTPLPSVTPTLAPTLSPSQYPSLSPSCAPSATPTYSPTVSPSLSPTLSPSVFPSLSPTASPSQVPTVGPSELPSYDPTSRPTSLPTSRPTSIPSSQPNSGPTGQPTSSPSSLIPSVSPTFFPTASTYLKYYATITLLNVSSSELDISDQLAVQSTTAQCSGLTLSNVLYINTSNVVLTTNITSNERRLQSSTLLYQMNVTLEFLIAAGSSQQANDYYSSYTSTLTENVDAGIYSNVLFAESVSFGAIDTVDAKALTVNYYDVQYISTQGSDDVGSDSDKMKFNILSAAVLIPAVLLFVVAMTSLSSRNTHIAALNELNTLVTEIFDSLLKCIMVYLTLALTISYANFSISAGLIAFSLLLFSRCMIIFLWGLVLVLVLRPNREALNRPSKDSDSSVRSHSRSQRKESLSLVLLLYKDAFKTKYDVTVNSLLVTLSLFDITFLRYLPWVRTDITYALQGYPTLFTMRACMYGTFASHLIQSMAVVVRIYVNTNGSQLSFQQQQESYLLLAVTLFNVIRSFITLMLSMQIVRTEKSKLVVVNEEDIAALASFYNLSHAAGGPPASSNAKEGSSRSGRGRVTLIPGKISQFFFGRSADQSIDGVDSQASTIETAKKAKGIPTSIGDDGRPSNTEISSISGLVDEADSGYVDDRRIRFSTATPFADETVEVLRFQLKKAGKVPVQFMPLEALQNEIADIFTAVNTGQAFDEARLDYLLMCLDCNPAYRIQKEQETQRWRSENEDYLQECLDTMRSYVPPYIFKASLKQLVDVDGMHVSIAKRLLSKKCLWLVRLSREDISRLHIAELAGRFNPEAQGLDVVEVAAIFAALPLAFTIADGEGKKERWRAGIEQQVKDLLKQQREGKLMKSRQRNPAYYCQTGLYGDRMTLHSMEAAASATDEPRQSFLNIKQMRQQGQDSAAGEVKESETGTETSVELVDMEIDRRKSRASTRLSILNQTNETKLANAERRGFLTDMLLNVFTGRGREQKKAESKEEVAENPMNINNNNNNHTNNNQNSNNDL